MPATPPHRGPPDLCGPLESPQQPFILRLCPKLQGGAGEGEAAWTQGLSPQLVPKLTRNYLKEGYMEKTGPKVRPVGSQASLCD